MSDEAVETSAMLRRVQLILTGAAAVMALLLWVVFGPVEGVFGGVIALAMVQGVWLGAGQVIGVLVGGLFGVALMGPIGRLLEGPLANAGIGGVAGRAAGAALAAILVTVVVAVIVGVIARVMIAKYEQLRAYDRYAGAVLGLFEGVVLGLLVLWTPVMLGPVAKAQRVAAEQRAEETGEAAPSNPAASAVEALAGVVDRSSLGGLARATVPSSASEMVALVGKFADVAADEEAFDRLLASEAMRVVAEDPAVKSALERLRDDPEVRWVLDSGGGRVTPTDIWALARSDRVLEVLEQTGAMEAVRSRAQEIAAAIEEASGEASSGAAAGGVD